MTDSRRAPTAARRSPFRLRPPHWYVPTIAAITLLATILRLYKLGDANVWEDEARTTWFQHFDIGTIFFATAQDTHPPLSYVLYHFWQLPTGTSAYAFRFLAAAFGIATIPVCGAIGKRLGGPAAGAISAFLLTISRFHVWWSEQIRMYSLITLLGAISLYCLFRSLDRWKVEPRRSRLLLLTTGIANLAGLYSLYFYVLLIVLESLLVLVVLLRRRSGAIFLWWTGLNLASILAFLPWLAYFQEHASTFASRGAPRPALQSFIEGSWSELAIGIDTDVARFRLLNTVLAVLLVGLLLWLIVRLGRRSAIALWLALVVVSVPVTAYLITLPQGLFFSPTYQTRYQLMAVPALVVLFGWGIANLPKALRILAVIGLAGTAVVPLRSLYQERRLVDDFQTPSRFIQAYEQAGDLIVIDPDSDAELFLFAYHGNLPWAGLPVNATLDAAKTDSYFSKWTTENRSIWLVQIAAGHDAGGNHPVHDWLTGHLHQSMSLPVGNTLVSLYEPNGSPARTLKPQFTPQHPIAGIAGVHGYDQPVTDVRPGDVVNVAIYGPSTSDAKLNFAGATLSGQALPGQIRFAVPINPTAPSGNVPLSVVLASGQRVSLDSLAVEAHTLPPAPAAVPVLANPVNRSFDGRALLTSYDVAPNPATAGQAVTINLQWKAQQPFAQDYTVFVHLLDAADKVVAQRDSQPQSGKSPTVQWSPGQTINDSYELTLPASVTPGDYAVEVGMYLQSTGDRLHLQDALSEDHLILGKVTVK